jgi:hypothetical protein
MASLYEVIGRCDENKEDGMGGNVACNREKKNTYRGLVGDLGECYHLED